MDFITPIWYTLWTMFMLSASVTAFFLIEKAHQTNDDGIEMLCGFGGIMIGVLSAFAWIGSGIALCHVTVGG